MYGIISFTLSNIRIMEIDDDVMRENINNLHFICSTQDPDQTFRSAHRQFSRTCNV